MCFFVFIRWLFFIYVIFGFGMLDIWVLSCVGWFFLVIWFVNGMVNIGVIGVVKWYGFVFKFEFE